MTEKFWGKTPYDSKVIPPYIIKKKQVDTFENNPATTQEVFRNDTTSVEVIVKQVKNKNNIESSKHNVETIIDDRLWEDVENLKREVYIANTNLENTKKCFRLVMFEIRKQLEVANQRELKRQTKCLVQQLENEKLKILLESKTHLVRKLKKELANVKRTIKLVSKGIRSIPVSDRSAQSDLEYTEFESDLKTNIGPTSVCNAGDGHEFTYETTLSSNMYSK